MDAKYKEFESLISSTYDSRTIEQLAKDAMSHGDPTLIQALQGTGLYIVEPTSGGNLYLLRIPAGASHPQLEKLPFSLPDLVTLSPFSLSSDDTRIFVAEKHTSLVELNVFTGSIRALYSSRESTYVSSETQGSPYYASTEHNHEGAPPDDDDALESPWVYIGRTDYTLRVHVRGQPHAMQTLHYRSYAPNKADQDVIGLWQQTMQPADHRAIIASPQNSTLVCFDLRLARNPSRFTSQPIPPILWSSTLTAEAIDVFDVVFAPPVMTSLDVPLLRPVIVPHSTGILPAILSQQRRPHRSDNQAGAYLGISPQGSLFAMGSDHFPLAAFAESAAVLQAGKPLSDLPLSTSAAGLLRPWIGGYQVPQVPATNHIPQLSGSVAVPLLGAPPEPSSWPRLTKRLVAQILGFLALALILLRGAYIIWRDARPVHMSTASLSFDDAKALGAPRAEPDSVAAAPCGDGENTEAPVENADAHAATTPSTSAQGPSTDSTAAENDPKKKRRRRGKRAGAAVSVRQARREGSQEAAQDLIAPSSHAGPNATFAAQSDSEAALSSSETGATRATEAPGPSTASGQPSSLQISDQVLGYGSSGTVVFRGTFQGRAVAVKRLLRDFVEMASKEVSLLQSADNHPNVIRYFCQELTPNFLYIALEQCPASLADLIERPFDHDELVHLLEPREALRQVTAGLQHLHSLSIVHRDIKPQNILVTLTSTQRLRFLLSDFGLSKRIDNMVNSTASHSFQPGGTVGWRAPELLKAQSLSQEGLSTRLSRAVDIFSLGCVAFYLLTGGNHPFGEQYEREMRIWQHQVDLSALERFGDDTIEAQSLIELMIQDQPGQRPSAVEVMRHPFFWPAQKRLTFLQDVSDRFEMLERDPLATAIELLERDAVAIVGTDWRKSFDKGFLDDLTKFRSYNSASVQDLLRVIRNKKHHFNDIPMALKKALSPVPEGFLLYFTRRFPRLFLHVYQVLEKLPLLRSEPIFRSYYEADVMSFH
ncbi:non-specific serine/threonine protein kinase [Malassezia nana]|uniref:non-specific serine/threonine protein kinase n=1 Tax=Malassezia nana TaxID=180528 RepID=A0AAF0J2L0_9BASI|nr:non-specific serine/threonine protein kinase [Malassezia nana]